MFFYYRFIGNRPVTSLVHGSLISTMPRYVKVAEALVRAVDSTTKLGQTPELEVCETESEDYLVRCSLASSQRGSTITSTTNMQNAFNS